MGFWVIKTGYWPVPFSLQIGGSFRQGQIWSKISTWKVFLLLKILYSLSKIWPISIKMAETSVDPHLPDITNSLVWHLNNIPSPRNSNVEKNLDIMKPTYSRHIWSVRWPFIISRFCCEYIINSVSTTFKLW